MSDQQKRSDSSIDWAERLKASLDAHDIDLTPTEPREDDDLAALLRAQISHTQADKTDMPTSSVSDIESEAASWTVLADPADSAVVDESDEAGPLTENAVLPPPTARSSEVTVSDSSIQAAVAVEVSIPSGAHTVKAPKTTDDAINPILITAMSEDAFVADNELSELRERNTALLLDESAPHAAIADLPEAMVFQAVADAQEESAPELTTPLGIQPQDAREHATQSAPTYDEAEADISYAIPLQTDFTPLKEKAPVESNKKTPRVSRMFGVYHIQNAPQSSHAHRIGAPTTGEHRLHDSRTTSYSVQMPQADPKASSIKDAELTMSIGYEQEIRRTETYATIEDARVHRRASEPVTSRREQSAINTTREFTDPSQKQVIDAAYVRALCRQPLLLLLAFAGGVFTLLYDILPIFGLEDTVLDAFSNTVFYPVVELELMLLICLPFLPRLIRGGMALLDFEPTRYSLPAVALLVTSAHAVLACFAPVGDRTLPLFGGVALLMLAISSLAEFLATMGERLAFSVASSDGDTYVLTDEETPASSAYADMTDSRDNAHIHRPLTAVRARRVADYFARTARYNPYMGRLNYLLPVALLVAIAVGGLTDILGGHPFYDVVCMFTATYLTCLPCGYLISMTLPMLLANHAQSKCGGAVIGAAAAAEYVGRSKNLLIFSDGSLLSVSEKKEFPLRDDPHAETYRRLTAYLLRLLEMPGAEPTALSENVTVEIAERGEDYLRVYLIKHPSDVKTETKAVSTEVMLGSHEALVRRGIRLPKRALEETYASNPGARTLYLAFDRRFCRLVTRTYDTTSVIDINARLALRGDRLALAGYDPFVKTEIFADLTQPPMVVHPIVIDPVRTACTGGLIATRKSTDLVDVYEAACRIQYTYRMSHLVSWLWMALVAVAAVLILVGGISAVVSTATVLIAQLAASILLLIFTVLCMRKKPIVMDNAAPSASKDPEADRKASANPSETAKSTTADRQLTTSEKESDS